MTVDGVLLGILSNYFRAAAEAAGYTLERTAHTTFIKESQDFSTGLITPSGEHFAYPTAIGADAYVGIDYSPFIEALAPWKEGDIGIANCPYATKGVSTHLPDYHLLKPIFHRGELLGFAWAFIHCSDMGGIVAGSIQPSAYEIYQEGIRITPTKLYVEGVLQEELKKVFLDNVRIPDQNWGDLNAVIAALGVGELRVLNAVEKWGLDVVREGREALINYTEQRARDIIRTFPDETWVFEDYLEDDFVSDVPVRVKLTITKDGPDGLHFDFTGSDPQVQASFNLATNGRHPFLCFAMFGYFRTQFPNLPNNGGLIRPFRFTAPEGTVVHAKFPAATGIRYALTQLIYTIVQGALTRIFPGKIPAAGSGQASIPAISTIDPETGRRQVTVIQPMIGGSGGRPWADGIEGCDLSLGSLRNTPCEVLEHEADVRILSYACVTDSGGAGYYRGGSALSLDLKVIHPDTILTARGMERTRFQPWGYHGGKVGAPSNCIVNRDRPDPRVIGKVNMERLDAGDVVSLSTPGGGGYGDPCKRNPAKVLDDVLDGFVSVESAARDYGVVIESGTVNTVETEKLRQSLSSKGQSEIDFGEARQAYMQKFSPEILDELAGKLANLPSSVRYSAKQIAFREMRGTFSGPVEHGWLSENWPKIEGKLFGTTS